MQKKIAIILCLILVFNLIIFSGTKAESNSIGLKSISIDKKWLTKGENVKFTVDIAIPDDSLKVYYQVWIRYISPSGGTIGDILEFNRTTGLFEGKIDINDNSFNGTYKLERVWISYGDNQATFYTKDMNFNNIKNVVPMDLSSWNFEVYGTNDTYPTFKSISYDKQTYDLNQNVIIEVEAEYIKPMSDYTEMTLQNAENNYITESFRLFKISETLSNGKYTAKYKGKYMMSPDKWVGQWFPYNIMLVSEGTNFYHSSIIHHSKTFKALYTKDFSSNSFKVSNTKAPGPKIIGSSIEKGTSNNLVTDKIEFYFDKPLSEILLGTEYNYKLTDEQGNRIWMQKECSGNTLRLYVGQLQPNSKYYLEIRPESVIADDGTLSAEGIQNFSFTTGSSTSASEGTKYYIMENTEITDNKNFKSDVVIAPGVNLTIKQRGNLTVSGNVIVYGSMINEGSFTTEKNLYINEYKEVINTPLSKGTFVNVGTKKESNLFIGNYPKPMLDFTPQISGDINATSVEFKINTCPFLNYTLNSKQGIIVKEGIQKETVRLNYGQNKLDFTVQDPFGNSSSKEISLNNTSRAIKIIDAFPVDNYTNIPVNNGIYIKFDSNISEGPGINNIILKNGKGVQQLITYKIEKDELVLYKVGIDLDYDSNYSITIPKDAVVDEVGNYVSDVYTLGFKTAKEITVLGGNNRYETSIKIAQEGWIKSDYAVLATGENFPDALSAAPLAAKYKAPILLVHSNKLEDNLAQEIERMQVKNVFIIGGVGAVSQEIESELKNKGIKVNRIFGENRYATSVAIAKQLDINRWSTVFFVTGENFPDALSVAAIAAAKQIPIILTQQNSLPKVTAQFFGETGISQLYIIGGEGAVSDRGFYDLRTTWGNRISGRNRYETNFNILLEFAEDLDFTYTFFATGKNFPDALSGSAFAAMINSPVILVDEDMDEEVIDNLKQNKNIMKMKYMLGGESVVPRSIIDRIIK